MSFSTDLYYAAERADAAYSAAVAAVTGGKRNRFELTPAERQLPAIAAAYRAKVDADAVWLTYMRSNAS